MSRTLEPAFDAAAADYDRRFTNRAPAAWLREQVRDTLLPYLEPGMSVLELGCGTGEDALWLARRGCRVLATDQSERMLDVLQSKLDGTLPVDAARFDMAADDSSQLPPGFMAGLLFSNFGAVNCIGDPAQVFGLARQVLRDDGIVALTVMGRFCLFETLYFLACGRWRTAARRWRGASRYRAGGRSHPVRYFTPSELSAAASGFDVVTVTGIGGLLPTSEAYWMWERWPRFFTRVARLDHRISRASWRFSDHYLLVLRKRRV